MGSSINNVTLLSTFLTPSSLSKKCHNFPFLLPHNYNFSLPLLPIVTCHNFLYPYTPIVTGDAILIKKIDVNFLPLPFPLSQTITIPWTLSPFQGVSSFVDGVLSKYSELYLQKKTIIKSLKIVSYTIHIYRVSVKSVNTLKIH